MGTSSDENKSKTMETYYSEEASAKVQRLRNGDTKENPPVVNFFSANTLELASSGHQRAHNKSNISRTILDDRKQRMMSAEDILTRHKGASDAPKVGYISKAQREKNLEEAAKQSQIDAHRRQDESKRRRRKFLRLAEINGDRKRRERQKIRESEHRKEEEERCKNLEEHILKKNVLSDKEPSLMNSNLACLNMLKLPEKDARTKLVEKELEQIREHYLGLKREKKKIQKPSEKFRTIFNFEWDASEDTSRSDNNPIYQNRPEPQLLFGRGFRAGVDVREQRKRNNFYDELLKRRLEHPELAESASKSKIEAISQKSKVIEDLDADNTHWSQKKREDMTDRDWRIFREDFDIYVKGSRVPPPIRTWAESPLPWELLETIKKVGYDKPTPIQMQAIPIALEMRDLIGIAVTGSGKTAAFVLPMLTYVKSLPPLTDETSLDGPYSLILAPSRELALQIFDETNKFGAFCKCRTVAVVGGRNAEAQAFELRRGAEIIIGTPGRIKDCLDRAYTVLSQCNYVILDEADRMIDMGFEEVVNNILDCIPTSNLKDDDEYVALQQELSVKAGHRRYRITQMFSATMPPAVEKLTKKYLRAPVHISIGDVGGGKRSITQRLEFITESKKKQRLQELLEILEPPIMVFVNMKKVADVVAKAIVKMNFRAVSLHGGKNQEDREDALASFKAGDYDILVATDVAGRGVDVEGVQAVINYDMPKDIQAYTHRIGRTGRAGLKGLAISFVTEDDTAIFYDLKQLLISTDNIVPPELAQHPASSIRPTTATTTAGKSAA